MTVQCYACEYISKTLFAINMVQHRRNKYEEDKGMLVTWRALGVGEGLGGRGCAIIKEII